MAYMLYGMISSLSLAHVQSPFRRIVVGERSRGTSDVDPRDQLRNATPFAEGPGFLIRDNDRKFGSCFRRIADGTGIEVLRTPIAAPRANAFCERFLGSVRRECLDHILIFSEHHLRRTIAEYVDYFNRSRPHQGIQQRIPEPDNTRSWLEPAVITARPILGGLHHDYRRAA